LGESVTFEAEGPRQRGRPRTRKTLKEVVDKHMDDMHIKLSDATDQSTGEWRRIIRGNWSQRSSDRDAKS